MLTTFRYSTFPLTFRIADIMGRARLRKAVAKQPRSRNDQLYIGKRSSDLAIAEVLYAGVSSPARRALTKKQSVWIRKFGKRLIGKIWVSLSKNVEDLEVQFLDSTVLLYTCYTLLYTVMQMYNKKILRKNC